MTTLRDRILSSIKVFVEFKLEQNSFLSSTPISIESAKNEMMSLKFIILNKLWTYYVFWQACISYTYSADSVWIMAQKKHILYTVKIILGTELIWKFIQVSNICKLMEFNELGSDKWLNQFDQKVTTGLLNVDLFCFSFKWLSSLFSNQINKYDKINDVILNVYHNPSNP